MIECPWRAPCALLFLAALVPAQDIVWRDARELRIEGQAFAGTAAPWDRLPASAEAAVPAPVWSLSRHAAGILVRFVTDAPRIEARWALSSEQLAMPHMPASGVSGLDLYVRGERGLRWVAATRPNARENHAKLANLGQGSGAPREFGLYLPLYNGLRTLEIGVPEGASLEPAPDRLAAQPPIVFYGTSITQGASASRPGTCHVALLGRRLDRPVVNLGFSGNGRMELPLADLIAEIEAAVYVVDCLPNMTPALVAERTVPFVRRLRERRPATPILLVEDRTFANAEFVPGRLEEHRARRAALRVAFDELRAGGVEGLEYLSGDRLLGADGDDTVDGSHPSDLGFARQADAFEPVLRGLLR
jgi:hypothetical protein